MALRNIHTEGDPVLSKVCRPVTDFNERLHILLDDMKETMTAAEGVGLAAPQVGIRRRAVVVLNGQGEILELVNPEIIAVDGEQTGPEGCLSVPGVYGLVTRPMTVRVRAQDRNGKPFEVEDSGLTARAFCHECAHLDGQLFTAVAQRIFSDEELAQMMQSGDETEGEQAE